MIKNESKKNANKKWYRKMPHSYILLFMIIILVTVLTYVIPAGEFGREEVNGRLVVVANSFSYTEQNPVGLFDMFQAIPAGMVAAANIVFIVFFASAFFKVIDSTGALENGIGVGVRKIRSKETSSTVLIWVVTFVFGLLGAVVGFENNIAIVPIGILVSLALGYDLMVGAAMTIGGIGLGFATSPINPYTVGVAHEIAELPVFSGFGLRTLYCLSSMAVLAFSISKYAKKIEANPSSSLVADVDTKGLNLSKNMEDYSMTGTHKAVIAVLLGTIGIIIFGTLKYKWYLQEITTVFFIGSIVVGIVSKMNPNDFVKIMIQGASEVTSGALIVGVARAISIILSSGNISDTIIYSLSMPLQNLPTMVSAVLMSLVHGIINFVIPSGSGQAMATMPIMIPLGDLLNMTRQTATLAFQIGDGITNLLYPTLGGLMAMLAVSRVPFDRWFKFIFPVVLKVTVAGWIYTIIGVAINWGPF